MSNFQVSLNNCDLEPIHIPGQIQSHGFLIVLDQQLYIKYVSENAAGFLQKTVTDLLGADVSFLEEVINNSPQLNFISQLLNFAQSNGFEQTNPYELKITGFSFYLIISRSAAYYLLEFEQAESVVSIDIQNQIGRSIAGMLGDKHLPSLLENTVQQIKSIIHYDRVMIYRFAEDGHGEVVAEALNDDLVPWLGLHYPASDIPQQARELYKRNLTRLISDVNDAPSKIVTLSAEVQPLDLTQSQLRAVSPIHIQYLKNMGVASSFSISLIYKDELWGLIACHNYTPKFIDYKSRESAKLIGQILSSALEFRQDEENQNLSDGREQALDKLTKYLNQYETITEALLQQPVNLMNLVRANGVVLFQDKQLTSLGTVPTEEELGPLLNWIKENMNSPVFATDQLTELFPEAAQLSKIASGVLVCTISKEMEEFMIWFKPELIQTINWAGNPEKPYEMGADGMASISPRNSFELWIQTIGGKSEAWPNGEINAVKQLRDEVIYALNRKANALRVMNDRLRAAYEELDTFSYTISHDLKTPISIIKTYAELLMREQNIGDRGQGFLDRIGRGADKMNAMISEVLEYSKMGRSEIKYTQIDMAAMIKEIITDLKVIYNSPDLQITLGNTPNISGDRTMLFQVFSNLISNAVKYSQQEGVAQVNISGVVTGNEIHYQITDNGIGIEEQDLAKLFTLFHRLANAKDFEGTGVGLSIVKRIVEKHQGRIWVESKIGQGSTFNLSFKKNNL